MNVRHNHDSRQGVRHVFALRVAAARPICFKVPIRQLDSSLGMLSRNTMRFGDSAGGSDVVRFRYAAREEIEAVPPGMSKAIANPGGTAADYVMEVVSEWLKLPLN